MQIRALTPTDAAAFQALRLRGLLECPTAFASSHAEEVDTPLDEIERRLAPQADSVMLGAFDGSTLCAVLGLQRERMVKLAHKAFIWGVYVAPEHRRDGVGAQLMGHALACAAAMPGVRQVNLGVNAQNAAALALYQRLGFVSHGLERGYLRVDGQLFDEHQMVRLVDAADRALAAINPSA